MHTEPSDGTPRPFVCRFPCSVLPAAGAALGRSTGEGSSGHQRLGEEGPSGGVGHRRTSLQRLFSGERKCYNVPLLLFLVKSWLVDSHLHGVPAGLAVGRARFARKIALRLVVTHPYMI